MKCNIKYVISLMFVLLFALGAWADPNITVIKQLNGDAVTTTSPGDVTYSVSDGTCTLTVTPGSGNFVTVESITVFSVVTGNVAQGRKKAPNLDVTPIEVTPVDASANPSGTTRYTFTMPADGSDVEVTVNFLSYEMYDLYIGGTQVTEFNREDIFDDGKVSYNPKTNILTLNNASIEVKNGVGIDYNGESANLTVHLLGINKMQCAESCKGFRATHKKFVFATDKDEPGKLNFSGEGQLFNDGTDFEYQNDLGLSTTGEGLMIGVFISYDLYVKGIRVTSVNKENILSDKDATVRFNPLTNTLLLYGANFKTTGDTPAVQSSLDGLTVDLRSTNTISFKFGFISELSKAPLIFTPNTIDPGQLSWEIESGGAFSQGFDITYKDPLVLRESENLISKAPVINYDLKIGNTQVTSVNCRDVFGDGTVSFDTFNTLALKRATLAAPITSGLEKLNVYLQDESTITCTGNLLTSTVSDAELSFDTAPNAPGKLVLTKNTGDWFSGFKVPVYKQNLTSTLEGNVMTVLDKSAIPPMNSEKKPNAEESIQKTTGSMNEAINNLLYTLPAAAYSYDQSTPGEPAGVVLNTIGTTDDTFYEKEPGTPEFANVFTGFTFMLGAGMGNVVVEAKINSGVKLAVQYGDADPILIPNGNDPTVEQMHKYLVPYAFSHPTYVFVYVKEEGISTARSDAPKRERVISGHVKITSLGVQSAALVMNNVYSNQSNSVDNQVKVYSVPDGAKVGDGTGIVLSTIEVEGEEMEEVTPSRGMHRAKKKLTKKITSLAPTVFDNVDKDKILYVDLSGTDIKDFTVNRSAGVMDGFGSNTLIYMPAGNDDGGEDNVVLNGTCASLSLSEKMSFRAHQGFTATKAELDRGFTSGQTATVFLPFGLSASQAASLGTFYTFKEIRGKEAVFNDAETGDINANTPYIFVPAGSSLSATDVVVEGLNDYTSSQDALIGTYQKKIWETAQNNIYGFAASGDGIVAAGDFVRVGDGAWIPPFRAYLQVAGAPSRLNVVIDGNETDGIDSLTSENVGVGTICDLQGRRMDSSLKKGLYIQNGKKFIVR